LALFARSGGLALINKLIAEAGQALPRGGLLLLEADPEQHQAIQSRAKPYELSHLTTRDYCIVFKKA
jgi:methylase of polypeptide subunit release factors